MSRLGGRVAVVTGAASGIGAATARRLAADGAHVVAADVDTDGLETTRAAIADGGGEAVVVRADVADPADNDAIVAAATERWGRLDIAFLNAGVAGFGGLFDVDLDEWDRHMAINLRGVFLGVRASALAMTDGGSIIVTSSVAGRRGIPSTVAYATSKHGVLGLVKASAIDLAPRRIRINAVCPGTIDTPILGPLHGSDDLAPALGPLQAMRRVGRPEEIAAVVAFLASDDASFITGESITADGGQANLLHLALTSDFMADISA